MQPTNLTPSLTAPPYSHEQVKTPGTPLLRIQPGYASGDWNDKILSDNGQGWPGNCRGPVTRKFVCELCERSTRRTPSRCDTSKPGFLVRVHRPSCVIKANTVRELSDSARRSWAQCARYNKLCSKRPHDQLFATGRFRRAALTPVAGGGNYNANTPSRHLCCLCSIAVEGSHSRAGMFGMTRSA